MKRYCLYHIDIDGIMSAAIVNLFVRDVTFIPMNYGYEVPWDILKGNEVYLVDFSIDDMERLDQECCLTWIDHHQKTGDFRGIHRIGTAGCELTWEWFSKDPMPRAVQLAGRWDVWDHKDPDCEPFQYGVRQLPPDPTHACWKHLLKGIGLDETVFRGKIIVNAMNALNEASVAGYGFMTELEGLRVAALNTERFGSKLFSSVWDPERMDAVMVYRWCPKAGCYSASIYTEKPDIDVGAIAKKYGGGGHKGAAGFRFTEHPFKETTDAI